MSAVLPVEAMFPRRLPWRRIFDDMKEHGCAYSKQAAIVGVEWSTYQRWLNESIEPRYSVAKAFLSMHEALCGAELTRQRQREGVLEG